MIMYHDALFLHRDHYIKVYAAEKYLLYKNVKEV